MHLQTRRGVALLSVTAALAGGTFTTITAAATAADGQNPSARLLGLPILGDLLSGILGQIAGATVATVEGLIAPLTSTQVGDLLQSANAAELTKLLEAAENTGQLTGALGTLDATETGDLLAPLTGTDLTRALGALPTSQLQSALGTLLPAELASVVDGLTAGQTAGLLTTAGPTDLAGLLGALTSGQLAGALGVLDATQLTTIVAGLTPAQITGLLGAGATDSVVSGLLGQATGLAGGTPTALPVDTLLAQVTALLGGGLPADPTDLASLLTLVDSLLGTSGLSTAVLTPLLGAANGLLGSAPAPVAAPLQGIVRQITVILTPVNGGTPTPIPTPAPTPSVALPATTIPRPAAATTAARPAAQFTAYRATIGALKLNKKRTSMKFTLTCAATAPKGCLVKVSAKIAGKSAMRSMTVVLPRGKASPVTVTFSKSTTKRLKTKGGTLRIRAQTALSSLPAATRTLKVKRLKPVRRTAR